MTDKHRRATTWKGSITERGTSMESYYGRNIVKEPVWKPEIPSDLINKHFCGLGIQLEEFLDWKNQAVDHRTNQQSREAEGQRMADDSYQQSSRCTQRAERN